MFRISLLAYALTLFTITSCRNSVAIVAPTNGFGMAVLSRQTTLRHHLQSDLLYKAINQLINQNPWRPSVVEYPTNASALTAAHRRLSSATRSNDDINWLVYFLMLSFHDLHDLYLWRFPYTEPYSMIFGIVSWRQTWPNHDNWRRLAVDSSTSWGPVRILTCCQTYSFVLCYPYDILSIILKHLFSQAWIRLFRSSVSVIGTFITLFLYRHSSSCA